MKRGMELIRRGLSVAIEKERDQQAQGDLKDSGGKRTAAPYDDCFGCGQEPGQFLQPDRTALAQIVPIISYTAANQRHTRDPVRRTWRTLVDEFLTCRDQA